MFIFILTALLLTHYKSHTSVMKFANIKVEAHMKMYYDTRKYIFITFKGALEGNEH